MALLVFLTESVKVAHSVPIPIFLSVRKRPISILSSMKYFLALLGTHIPIHLQMLNTPMTQPLITHWHRTNETLSWILHLLQHLAAALSLLLHVDADSTCNCPRSSNPLQMPLSSILHLLLSRAKYFGSYITPSSSTPDVNFRCSQASSALESLNPLFRHPLISQRYILRLSKPFFWLWIPGLLSSSNRQNW